MTDDAQSVGDNAELEDIAKMPIDIELLDLRISRSMRRHGTIGSFIRIINPSNEIKIEIDEFLRLVDGFLETEDKIASLVKDVCK